MARIAVLIANAADRVAEVRGPRNGITRYGPVRAPHLPSVWPKSRSFFSRPAAVAGSIRPPIPTVVLSSRRPVSERKA